MAPSALWQQCVFFPPLLIISLKLPLNSSTLHPAFMFLPARDIMRAKRPYVNTHSMMVCVHEHAFTSLCSFVCAFVGMHVPEHTVASLKYPSQCFDVLVHNLSLGHCSLWRVFMTLITEIKVIIN